MKLYLSGPMTGQPAFNTAAFNEAADRLRAAGHEVVNPADTGIIEGWSWGDYMRFGVKLLMDCQGVATLPGWNDSRGARIEVNVARCLGLDVRLISAWLP